MQVVTLKRLSLKPAKRVNNCKRSHISKLCSKMSSICLSTGSFGCDVAMDAATSNYVNISVFVEIFRAQSSYGAQ